MVTAAPPSTGIFFNSRVSTEKNATHRPSGEKNGVVTPVPWVPEIPTDSGASSLRRYSWLLALKTMFEPSGEIVRIGRPVLVSSNPSGRRKDNWIGVAA